MNSENLTRILSIVEDYRKASDNTPEKTALFEQEKALLRTLTPEERYDYNLQLVAESEGVTPGEIDADIERKSNSSDPAIKAGFIEGYYRAYKELEVQLKAAGFDVDGPEIF